MKKWNIVMCWTALMLVGATCRAGHMSDPYVGSKEFERVKSLAGHWEGTTQEGVPDHKLAQIIAVDYKVTSNGSAVIETLFPGTPDEMTSVYHDEGGQLTMTHYCSMGNRPHMKLINVTPTALTLEVPKKGGNVKPNEMHMHSVKLETPAPDTLKHTWISSNFDKTKTPPVFTFKRKG
jgi:hypothetical protein